MQSMLCRTFTNKHIAKVLYELVNFTMDHCPIFLRDRYYSLYKYLVVGRFVNFN